MKKLIFLALCAFACFGFKMSSGDCSVIIFFKEGTSTTMTSYDDDDKLTGTTKTVYSKVTKTAGGAEVTANQENYNKKGKLNSKSEFTIKCNKGVLTFDMRSMLSAEQQDSYKDFEMTMEGADKEIPAELVVGNSLKDADIKMTVKTKQGGTPMPMMNTNIKVTNRKVEAKEKVTTPAGTFECYKISENVEFKTLFSIKMKSVSWFSYEAGNVKSETYKDNGKFVGKSELTELIKK